MRLHYCAVVAVLATGIPAIASAQATTAVPNNTTQPATTAETVATPQTTTTTEHTVTFGSPANHWFASGFVGSNFGASATKSSADFGGSLGYMWSDSVGAEFLAGFTPNFQLQNGLLLGDRPQVNSYMINAIAGVPIGSDHQFQPFVSGGIGAITLRTDVLNNTTGNDVSNTFRPDATRLGGNIGGGFMTYAGNWGIRGDVRYFRAFSSNNLSTTSGTTPAASAVADALLPGLDFWRANIGVAVRW